MTEDQTFAEWYKHCLQNPLLKKKGIPECILFVTQRLTKYPLLIQPLLKSSIDDKVEHDKLSKAMFFVKEILVDVDSRVADKDKEDRQLEIFKRIDAKSHAILKLIDERSDAKEIKIKEMKFKKSDIISSNRKLKWVANWNCNLKTYLTFEFCKKVWRCCNVDARKIENADCARSCAVRLSLLSSGELE